MENIYLTGFRGAVQKQFLEDMSAKGVGQNSCPLRKCKFFGEKIKKAWDVLKRKNMLRNFSEIFVRVSAKTFSYFLKY